MRASSATSRPCRWSAVALLGGSLLTPTPALAEPVRVTDGVLVGDAFGATLTASGERGLTIWASGDKGGGNYGPAQCAPCLPGDLVDIDSSWSGSDFPGVVSIDGDTFVVDVGTGTTGSLLAAFEGGNVLVPAFAGQPIAVLSAPFSFHGFLMYPIEPGVVRPNETFLGIGTATLRFEWNPASSDWSFSAARYEFSPVPEPASLTLFVFGLAGLGARRCRHRTPR